MKYRVFDSKTVGGCTHQKKSTRKFNPMLAITASGYLTLNSDAVRLLGLVPGMRGITLLQNPNRPHDFVIVKDIHQGVVYSPNDGVFRTRWNVLITELLTSHKLNNQRKGSIQFNLDPNPIILVDMDGMIGYEITLVKASVRKGQKKAQMSIAA